MPPIDMYQGEGDEDGWGGDWWLSHVPPSPDAPALNAPKAASPRRNPMSANPRRTGGPPPPLSAKALAAARKVWLANFRKTRGFPPGFDRKLIEHYRSLKLWYKDMAPPDR